MKSRLQVAGHPIHAMVVAFPIGLYNIALVWDILYVALGTEFWFRAAFWTIVFGVLGHLMAVTTGLPDYMAIRREQRSAQSAANSHLIFGVALLVIQGLNLGIRNAGVPVAGDTPVMPLIVNLIAVAVLGIQSWYGGELVYRHRIGIEMPELQTDGPANRKGKKRHT